ncbi:MAG: hypothetical protein JRJ44_00420 [Deltaproteobacteria bacterium]|nr:hypothetical protein [Deltaproteobacteria bacterium]
MKFKFFGVYFQDAQDVEYRCGFHDNDGYMPLLEKRSDNDWVEVNQNKGTGAANQTCRNIRGGLPVPISFPEEHTQNERVELINQIIYNINRHMTERVNYRGAHG